MKKLLLIALLIVGCGTIEPEDCESLPNSYPLIHNQVSVYEHRLYDNANNFLNDIPDSTYIDSFIIKETEEDYYIREMYTSQYPDSVYFDMLKNEDQRVIIIGNIIENEINLDEKPLVWADFNETINMDTTKYGYFSDDYDSSRSISEIEFMGICYETYVYNIYYDNSTKTGNVTDGNIAFSKLGYHSSSQVTEYNANEMDNFYMRVKLVRTYIQSP